MSDTPPSPSPDATPPADPTPPAPVVTQDPALLAKIAELETALSNLSRAQADAAAAAVPGAPAPVVRGTVKVGDLVEYTYDGPHGPITSYGLAVKVDTQSELGDRVQVAWFRGMSGPILAAELQAETL